MFILCYIGAEITVTPPPYFQPSVACLALLSSWPRQFRKKAVATSFDINLIIPPKVNKNSEISIFFKQVTYPLLRQPLFRFA